MEKNIDCDIVQDLLIGYADEVLNDKSKKMVEEHLLNCENCQKRLEEIKKDMKINSNNQKKEIDYLKKIRRKTRIKSIFLAIGIIIFILLSIYIYKFIIISDLINKSVKTLETNNYYVESATILGEGETALSKQFYKDGKFKIISQIYSDDGVENLFTSYGEINSDKEIRLDHKTDKVTVSQGEITRNLNKEENIKRNYFYPETNYLTVRFGTPLMKEISKDTYDIGREYYILKDLFVKNQIHEVWIDKETGLVLREIYQNYNKIYFPKSTVIKEVSDSVIETKYKFDIVTDSDVTPIDITQYEVEYVRTNIEDLIN